MRVMRSLALIVLAAACSSPASVRPDGSGSDTPDARDISSPDAGYPATLDGNRDRLLASYLAYLHAHPDMNMSNGLLGGTLATTCALWQALDPSSRAVFLTLTHRLERSQLADDSAMLDHVTRAYRIIGGEGATATAPGSCGGGEANRLILAVDAPLHAALVAAHTRGGATPYDLRDVGTGHWRDSHDLGGPHSPFDQSDETNDDVPRGQVQYFADPASARAQQPLGRVDVMDLVEPYALEIDHDYDCIHQSNPLCSYTLYGVACTPATSKLGTVLYTAGYGDFEPAWQPSGCD
jgi:hypothetical protein